MSRSGSPELEVVANGGSRAGGFGGRAHGDRNVGLNALFAVGAIARRIELGGGQFEAGGSRPEREDALHGAFAVGPSADDGGTVVVLKRTGQDFAGTGTVAVNQDIDRQSPPGRAACRQRLCLPLGSPASGNDQSLVDEPLGDLDGHVEQTTGVAPEVEHQDPHALIGKRGQGPVDLLGRGFLEARELEVADSFGGVEELDARDAFDVDMATNELVASGRAVAPL